MSSFSLAVKESDGMSIAAATPIPSRIPNLALWLDAADRTTIQTSSGSVTAWYDKSSNHYMSYSTAGRNPTSGTVTVNGLNTVSYVTGQTSLIDNFVLAQTMSIFQVYVPVNQGIGSPFLEHGPNANPGGSPGFYFWSGGGANYLISSKTSSPYVYITCDVGNVTVTNTIQLLEGIHPDPANDKISFYTNGTFRASATKIPNTLTITDRLYINGRNNTNTVSYACYMPELLIYNTALSIADRQMVEGYLASKWGLPLPTGHPYAILKLMGSSAITMSRPIPNLMPGLQLWLDAADSNTIQRAGGTNNVTAWADKSSNGYNFAQGISDVRPTLVAYGFNSMNTIHFTSSLSQFLSNGTALPIGTNSTTLMCVARTVATNTSVSIFAKSTATGSGTGKLHLSRSTGTLKFGTEGPSAGAWSVTVADTYPANTYRILGVVCDRSAGLTTGFQNGLLYGTPKSFTPDTTTNLTTTYRSIVGAYNDSGGGVPDGSYLNGDICEILIFSAALSPTQRQMVEGYFASKWGLPLPVGHPYGMLRLKITPIVLVIPVPTLLPGLQLWLDAADPNTVGLSGTNVTQWLDKSGYGRTLTNTGGNPTYANNRIYFTPGVYLTGTSFTSSTAINIFIVWSTTASGRQRLYNYGYTGQYILGYFDTTYIGLHYSASLGKYYGPIPFSQNSNYLYSANTRNSTTLTYSINGTESGSWTNNEISSAASSYLYVGGSGGLDFTGSIMEVLQYDAFVSPAQRLMVEGYLASKWGLPLPTSNPFSVLQMKLPQAAAQSPYIQPNLPYTPAVYLIASLYSGSGTWYDSSPNGRNASLTEGAAAKNTDGNGIVLDGATCWTFSNAQLGNAWTVSVWYKHTAAPTNVQASVVAQIWNGSVTNFTLDYDTINRTGGAGFASLNGAWILGPITLGNYPIWTHLTGTWNGSTICVYVNGTLLSSSNSAVVSTDNGSNYTIGCSWGFATPTHFVKGEIGEVRMYPAALTAAQVATDYTFGAQFYTFTPKSISGLQLWLDGMDASTISPSVSAVTTWSDKSGSNNHLTSNSGAATTYSANGVQFAATTLMYTPLSAIMCNATHFIVHNMTSSTGDGLIFRGASASIWGVTYLPRFNGTNSLICAYGDAALQFTPAATLNVMRQVGFITSNGKPYANIDGALSLTSSAAFTAGSAQGTIFGGGYGGGYPYTGSVNEMIVYNTPLDSNLRQAVEGYIAWKWWGATNPLPAGHPWKTFGPAK